MPLRVPTFQPQTQGAPEKHALQVKTPEDEYGSAMVQAGKGLDVIGKNLQYLQELEDKERKTARDTFEKSMALVNMEKGLAEFNEKMAGRTDWGNIPTEHKEYGDKLVQEIIGGIEDPEVRKAVYPQLQMKVLHNQVQVKYFSRNLENDYMLADYQKNVDWFSKLIGTTTDDYARADYEQEFRTMTKEFVDAGIIRADKAEGIVSSTLGKADHIRLNQWLDSDPQMVVERIKDPKFLPNLDPLIRSSAARTAENNMLHIENMKQQKIHRMQEQNAEKASDLWDAFRHGKMTYSQFSANMRGMREPDANGVRPINRQVFDMYMANADNYIKALKNENKEKQNPAQYVQLTRELLDEKNPLTLDKLEGMIKNNTIDPKYAVHFADAVKMRDVAEGKAEAMTEKQQRNKLAGQILMDEMKFVTNSFSGKTVAAEDMWKVTQQVQDLVMTTANTGEPLDRNEIHKKVAVLIEPLARSWLSKMWHAVTDSSDQRDTKLDSWIGTESIGTPSPTNYQIGGMYNGKKIKDIGREKGIPKALKLEDGTTVQVN